MKKTAKQPQRNLRPKHKHTKEYLKHYYPFIPLFISITALIMVILRPVHFSNTKVLGTTTNINPASLLEHTNIERQKNNIPGLQEDLLLEKAAQAKADDMQKRNYWAHQTPEGKDPWIFIATVGYNYAKAGENLAYGFNDSKTIIDGWLNSPSHRKNMLDTTFSEVGFGIASSQNFNGDGPAIIVVAMYGLPIEQAVSESPRMDVLGGQANQIRNIQLYTNQAWMTYLIGGVIGASIMYLLITHSLVVRRVIKKGEKFVIRNPVLDSIVISLIAVGILLLQTAGSIQ
jgi:hypothetical protein